MIKPFIIECQTVEECRSALIYLGKQGYGASVPGFHVYIDDTPDWRCIAVHSGGAVVNTRRSVAACRADLSTTSGDELKTCPVFKSYRAFAISNRNMSFDGKSRVDWFI